MQWQRILNSDLDAAIPPRRGEHAVARVTDGPGGALWAGGDAGVEHVMLLPQFVSSNWREARFGLIGSGVPRTVVFHATNAYDKQLALKAAGLWRYELGSPREREMIAGLPWLSEGVRHNRSGSGEQYGSGLPRTVAMAHGTPRTGAPAIGSASFDAYVAEVLEPLLLLARATKRIPATPWVSCEHTPWLIPPGAGKVRERERRAGGGERLRLPPT